MAFVLAHLEIQIEGPTLGGKLQPGAGTAPASAAAREASDGIPPLPPTLILLFLHVPQFYGASWEREADTARDFFFLTVTGTSLVRVQPPFRHDPVPQGQVWWFPLGLPASPALPHASHSPSPPPSRRLLDGSVDGSRPAWGLVFAELLALTISRSPSRGCRDGRRPRRAANQAD